MHRLRFPRPRTKRRARHGYAVDALAEDAAELIRQTQCGPCHFVGHSLGAFVGLRLAARHPELIRSLVLLSASADPQPRLDVVRYRVLQALARRVGLRPLAPTLMRVLFGGPSCVIRTVPRNGRRGVR